MDNVGAILQEIENKLRNAYNILEVKDINYGRQFKIKVDNDTINFRVFYNKKGDIKYDYSTIKDSFFLSKLSGYLEGKVIKVQQEHVNQDTVDNEKVNPFTNAIGTDESGKGDYFGPLVVAGVYVNEKTKVILDNNGVRDSKKIGDKKILELANMIKRVCVNQYVIVEIAPLTYNNLYESFKKEGKNLNTLLAWGHAKAIEEVLAKVDCELAISDKFADERFIISQLQEKGREITLKQEHKAEKYTSVAAASILARARFLEKMNKLSIEYGMKLSKGASKKVVLQARSLVDNNTVGILKNVAKVHFKTTDKVMN
ncbi:ribonuclease HIII [Maribacter sp.]|uniref:ribonuclease HIII n=1 Tax=Maribacter sp. TaxID=1897614 RepID=UPI0025BB9E6B|nr:ribonuclease HIII [Maribacter sp.]